MNNRLSVMLFMSIAMACHGHGIEWADGRAVDIEGSRSLCCWACEAAGICQQHGRKSPLGRLLLLSQGPGAAKTPTPAHSRIFACVAVCCCCPVDCENAGFELRVEGEVALKEAAGGIWEGIQTKRDLAILVAIQVRYPGQEQGPAR